MSDKETGGPAFPRPDSISPDGTFWEAGNDGMSLRDWFAGQSLSGVLMKMEGQAPSLKVVGQLAAKAAYAIADAMVEEQKK